MESFGALSGLIMRAALAGADPERDRLMLMTVAALAGAEPMACSVTWWARRAGVVDLRTVKRSLVRLVEAGLLIYEDRALRLGVAAIQALGRRDGWNAKPDGGDVGPALAPKGRTAPVKPTSHDDRLSRPVTTTGHHDQSRRPVTMTSHDDWSDCPVVTVTSGHGDQSDWSPLPVETGHDDHPGLVTVTSALYMSSSVSSSLASSDLPLPYPTPATTGDLSTSDEPAGWGPEPELQPVRPSGMYLAPKPRVEADEGWDSGEIARRDIATFEAMAAQPQPDFDPDVAGLWATLETRLLELPALRRRGAKQFMSGLERDRVSQIVAVATAAGLTQAQALRLLLELAPSAVDVDRPLAYLETMVKRHLSEPTPAAAPRNGRGGGQGKGLSYDWASELAQAEKGLNREG